MVPVGPCGSEMWPIQMNKGCKWKGLDFIPLLLSSPSPQLPSLIYTNGPYHRFTETLSMSICPCSLFCPLGLVCKATMCVLWPGYFRTWREQQRAGRTLLRGKTPHLPNPKKDFLLFPKELKKFGFLFDLDNLPTVTNANLSVLLCFVVVRWRFIMLVPPIKSIEVVKS